MRTAPIQNTGVYDNNTVSKNNLNTNQTKMRISQNYSQLNMQKSNNPAFGWFGLDDLFYYFNKKLNASREAKRKEQIEETNKKVVDDISLMSKKMRIPVSVARDKYNEYLKIGGIEPNKNGHEIGLNKVIGYSNEKLDLIKDVVTPIVMKQKAVQSGQQPPEDLKIPNGVLVYGPNGRGKSYMLESLVEHFKIKSRQDGLKIKTFVINRPWNLGDTDENAYAIADTFEDAKKFNEESNGHSIIYVNNLDNLLDEDEHPILCAEFLNATTNCAKDNITWIGSVCSPKLEPQWLFNPSRTDICLAVRNMSDPEMSALMSYFWAQKDRQDNSDHNKVLNYLNETGMNVYPPVFKQIADNVDKKLKEQDYDNYKRGRYKKPVETQDVISALEEYRTDLVLQKQARPRALSALDSLTDDAYIAKIQEKHNANK